MSELHTKAEMEVRLWEEIKKVRYGMLGVVGGAPKQHFQPMTAFVEPDTGGLWFFSKIDTDLARSAAGEGCAVMFIVQAKDQNFQACIGGTLHQHMDRERMDKYWNPIVAAWYPEGKDDPTLGMLHLKASDAQVWLSEAGKVSFAIEIAKANLTKSIPDVGETATLDLGGGQTSTPH